MPETKPTQTPEVDATAAKPAKPVKAPKPPKAEKPAKEPKVERPKLEVRNDISRPSDPTKGTGLVWAIADEISKKNGTPAARAEVMEVAKNAPHSINEATIATQYGKWRTFNGLKGQPPIRKTVEAPVPGVATAGEAAAAAAAV